jgi:hypothetical protein
MRTVQRALIPVALGSAVIVGVFLGAAGAQESTRMEAPVRRIGAIRIATADVLGVVERMIMSDRYRPAQVAFTNQQNDKLKPLADELVALETRGSSLPTGSPDLEALTKQFDQKRDEFQRARQEAMAKIDAFNTDQVREAYRLTLTALNDLATRQGYTHVLSSRTGAATIRSDNVTGALQEILARPVAKSDPDDDLTDALIRQFKLENVKVDEGTPAQLGTPAVQPAPRAAPPPASPPATPRK